MPASAPADDGSAVLSNTGGRALVMTASTEAAEEREMYERDGIDWRADEGFDPAKDCAKDGSGVALGVAVAAEETEGPAGAAVHVPVSPPLSDQADTLATADDNAFGDCVSKGACGVCVAGDGAAASDDGRAASSVGAAPAADPPASPAALGAAEAGGASAADVSSARGCWPPKGGEAPALGLCRGA